MSEWRGRGGEVGVNEEMHPRPFEARPLQLARI